MRLRAVAQRDDTGELAHGLQRSQAPEKLGATLPLELRILNTWKDQDDWPAQAGQRVHVLGQQGMKEGSAAGQIPGLRPRLERPASREEKHAHLRARLPLR